MPNIAEHLLIGKTGHFFVLLAFVASLLSTIAYFKASYTEQPAEKASWLRYARLSFFIQTFSVLAVFLVIFIICKNHYYEYLYAFKHTSNELEPKYLLACIWEDQSGSFLLWSIWHCLLGIILIARGRDWESPVLTVISLAQCFIALMLMGVYIFNVKIGNSPFALTKHELDAPFLAQENYLPALTRMHEENRMGLNVLLRNYWMVIHPPVLFLGFASTIVPFAFAYAGIQSKRFTEWIKPALPWALFSACVLGVGVMMGGKWAYESLNFGGYWAWDPVENASLVPWMVLVSGIHCMVIYRATGQSLRASYLFSFLSFVFVLVATFLTRTGILGDTSVHAFVEAGLPMKLLIATFMLAFTIPSLWLFAANYKRIPTVIKEEAASSREFWMFIGSLVFFLSAIFIITKTSWPVLHNWFASEQNKLAPGENSEYSYNKVVVLIAVIVGILTAISQYFKYKSTPKGYTLKKIALPTLVAAIITVSMAIFYPITYYKETTGFLGAIYVALFASIYSAVANAAYLWIGLNGKLRGAGGSIAHLGFAVMIAGMLISSGNKTLISDNRVTGLNLDMGVDPQTKQQDNPLENLTLARMVPTRMGPYVVTYLKDSAGGEKDRMFYQLLFERKDSATQKTIESFYLYPDVYLMKGGSMSSNPDTRAYFSKDVFTYISYAVNKKEADQDTASYHITEMGEGDTAYYSKGYMILNKVKAVKGDDSAARFELTAELSVTSNDGSHYQARPSIRGEGNNITYSDDTLYQQNLFTRFSGVTEGKKIKLGTRETNRLVDFIAVKAYIFPYINLVWAGLIIMAIGFVISIINRAAFSKPVSAALLILVASALVYMFLLAN